MYATQLPGARPGAFANPNVAFSTFQALRSRYRIQNGRGIAASTLPVRLESTLSNYESFNCRQDLALTKSKGLSAQKEIQLGMYVDPVSLYNKTNQKVVKERETRGKNVIAGTRYRAISRNDLESNHDNKGRGKILEISTENIEGLAAECLEERSETRQEASGLWDLQLEPSNLSSKPVSHRNLDITKSTISNLRPARILLEAQKPADKPPEPWQTQKAALVKKFPGGWNPRKRLSPDALAGIRAIHSQFPEQYTTRVIAEKFEVSPEAVRRILKSNWTPKDEEESDRRRRWFSRGQKMWDRYAELGLKPPAPWRQAGICKAMDRAERAKLKTYTTVRGVDSTRGVAQKMTRGGRLADRIL
jgi:hypothetical protein